jgi:hypothetical protein
LNLFCSRYSHASMLGEQSFDMRNVCIHSSGLLLFEPPGDNEDAPSEHTHLCLESIIYSANVRYGYPATIMRNEVYPSQFQSPSPHSTLLLAFGHPMSQVGHHVFESVLAAFATIKAAALETTSKLHVLLASHYFSPPFASSSTSPKENLLRSFWTSAIGQKPLSVGEFFQANSVSPNAPVCYRRVIVGSIQDKRVPHPTLGFKCCIHDTTFFRCPRVGSFHI